MSDDALQIVKSLFDIIWTLFTSWHIPGTEMTPAVLALFIAAAGIALRFVLQLFSSNSASAGTALGNAKFIKSKGE